MNRSSTFTSLAILATLTAPPLFAQAPSGGAPIGYLSADTGSVVGGGDAALIGGGDDWSLLYSRGGAGGGAGMAQPGRLARFGNRLGETPTIEYLDPEPAGHGREAWLIGGGEDFAVVYTSPTRH